ncbi:MAG: TatD family hydrolase [Lachnospiraceae bacterium]|nr:TatD family hydrolase [Lachnospiraceae bacterium]
MEKEKFYYFESHCHPDHPLVEDKSLYMQEAKNAGVKYLVVAPITYESNYSSLELFPKSDYPNVLFAKGLHPKYAYNIAMWDNKTKEEFCNMLESDKRIAALKSGIDLCKKNLQPNQINREFEFLSLFNELAYKYKKPLVLHIRDAAEETLDFFKENPLKVPAEFHCFNYDKKTMERYIEAGVRYFGIGGKVTLDESIDLQDAVSQMDLSMLLLESDAPFVKVKGETEKINTTARALPAVAEKIAELKGLTPEEVIRISYLNACRFFGIK